MSGRLQIWYASDQGQRDVQEDQQGVLQRVEDRKEKKEHDQERDGNDQCQPLVGLLLEFELPPPTYEVSRGELDLFPNRLLAVPDERSDVPATYVALHRDESLVVLPGDLPGAHDFLDPPQIGQRHLLPARRPHQDPADRIPRASAPMGIPDDDVETGNPLENLTRLLAPDGGLDDALDVLDVDPVAGDGLPVPPDGELGRAG